ncbi:MAG: peroxiredoxin family protein [Candidatus Micrarchaeota archaeon]
MEIKDVLIKSLPFVGILLLIAFIGYGLLGTSNAGSSDANVKYNVGSIAPDFTLPTVEGGTFKLSDLKGKKNVLLYFQEGIMCPPCWQQQVDLEKQKVELDKMNVEIVMITVDPPQALLKNKMQYGITSKLLYDNDLVASNLYDTLKDSMHPGERPGHIFVLVDTEGKIVWRYSAYKASIDPSNHHGGSGTMYVPVSQVLSSMKTALAN